ncbi:serine/threonine-protein kinase HipA [Chitinophaga skermanii]|uniref:Serine/threonine-protein kinase HipA n=1 Tax=Chitinophaga skermanii TaxID=331697 RepID=A0A327QVV3_9BACT|nr:HipA N-terminal domain-containing protein [Chitinophaga skermanii]RAJ08471.1 serine/threonine-protein kinase HipA [Chitinophaga skermanii]
MKIVQVYYNTELAGILSKNGGIYRFQYDEAYLNKPGSKPISLTMPLKLSTYESDTLFPAFVNLLSEGANKAFQSRSFKIDERDYFSLLLATEGGDRIGPISIKQYHAPTQD